jgi:hypothetical protein
MDFISKTSLIASEWFLNKNPICPLLDLPTVPSFGENQMFKGRGIFKEEERFLKKIENKMTYNIKWPHTFIKWPYIITK